MYYEVKVTVAGTDEGVPGIEITLQGEEDNILDGNFDEAIFAAREALNDFYFPEEDSLDEGTVADEQEFLREQLAELVLPADPKETYDPVLCAGCPDEAQCAAEAWAAVSGGPESGLRPLLLFDAAEPEADPLIVYLVDPQEGGQA